MASNMTEFQARGVILTLGNRPNNGNLSQEELADLATAAQVVADNYNLGGMNIYWASLLLQQSCYRELPGNLSIQAACRLSDKYLNLAPLLLTFEQLLVCERYQQMWKDGQQRFVLDINEGTFSLHDRSTSLAIFKESVPGANDNFFRALLPLDVRRNFAGFKNPTQAQAEDAVYQALGPNWPADTNIKVGDPPLPEGSKHSQQRARCLACGFVASLGWRRRITRDRNFCQNSYCPQKARDSHDKSEKYPGVIKRGHGKDKDTAGKKLKRSERDSAQGGRKKSAGGMASAPIPLMVQ